jgi:hypothetical protein
MKVYAVIDGEREDRFTAGIFSTWAKAYDFAMKPYPRLWRPCIDICVYEVDGDIIWGPGTVIQMPKGDKTRWVNPEYSTDIDPTDNTNQQGESQ